MMPRRTIEPQHDFEAIKHAFNRWRAENAAYLTRDEAVRFALGEWLIREGYLPEQPAGLARVAVPRPVFAPHEWE